MSAAAAILLDTREALRHAEPAPGELHAEMQVTVNGACTLVLRLRQGDRVRELDERQVAALADAIKNFDDDERVLALMAVLEPGIARLRSVWWLRGVVARFAELAAEEERRPEGSRRDALTTKVIDVRF